MWKTQIFGLSFQQSRSGNFLKNLGDRDTTSPDTCLAWAEAGALPWNVTAAAHRPMNAI